MEKILMIGGTGNIGLPLIQCLATNQNSQIIAGVHNVQKAQRTLAGIERLEIRHFDFLDATTFPTAFSGVSRVFFVRPPQLSKPKTDMLPFLKYVKQQRIHQLVFVSLMGVEKNPMTPHHKIEKMIQQLDIPHTFIRPSFFMQNLNTTHRFDIQQRHDLFIPAGHAQTSFIDTRDIGEVAGVCLTDDRYLNQALEITGPQALTYDEIAKIMTEVLGTPITYSRPGLLKFRRVMLRRGIKKEFVNVMVMLYLITQLGNAKKVTDTAERVLKRPPRDIRTYVQDYRDYFLPAK